MAVTTSIDRNSNAHQIIDAVLTYVFAHERRRQSIIIDNFASRNSCSVFMHKGLTFRASFGGGRRGELDEHLWDEFEMFLKDKDRMDWSCKKLWQILFSLLHPCTSLEDVRNALPEFLVEIIPSLSVYSRTEEEAYTLEDPRTIRQYQKARDEMELWVKLAKNPSLGALMSFYHYEV